MKNLINILVAIVALSPVVASAEDLSNVSVFHRCYAHLTQTRVPLSSTLLAQVKNNQKDPIAACLEVLDSARFTLSTNTQIDANNSLAKQVLRAMHHVHASWFSNKEFILLGTATRTEGSRAALDITAPASYYTKALFDSNMKLSDILTTNQNLSPVRTIMNPTTTQIPPAQSSWSYQSDFKFAPIGDIIGVYSRTGISMSGNDRGTQDISFSMGGGILGSQAYMRSTINEDGGFYADGAVKMPRKWARAVYTDLLCRDLPAVRVADGTPFVNTAASAPFRRSQACVYCHASMDRTAGVLRNISFHRVGSDSLSGGDLVSTTFKTRGETSTAAMEPWLNSGSGSYRRSLPPTGVFYFRNYKSELVSLNVGDINDLGLKISQQDDFYICAAKRYYEYFTGVKADIGDLGDPARATTLSTADQKHRDIVINLGIKLKGHQNPRATIEEILRLPAYKKSDYNRENP